MLNKTSPYHAIVLGGSIAGLLTARILAQYIEKVTIIEKDVLPINPGTRKSVPQGHHPHVILSKALQLIEKWFPEFIDDMASVGAIPVDPANDVCWFFPLSWMPRYSSGIKVLSSLRPQIEWCLKKSLLASFSNVTILENHSAIGLFTNKDNTCITGVKLKTPFGDIEQMDATITIDTTGHTSRTPDWLASIGYEKPKEEEVVINVGYTTRIYKRPDDFKEGWRGYGILPDFPKTSRGAVLSTVQNNQWIISLTGYSGDHAPVDDIGFMQFARSLPKTHLYNLLKNETPLSSTKVFKLLKIRRRYYEKLSHFPDGLIVLGDALCTFNPIFGQGITVASICAEELERLLQKGVTPDMKRFSETFHLKASKRVSMAWHLSNIINFSYSQVKTKRRMFLPSMRWFLKKTLETCSKNPKVGQVFLELFQMNTGIKTIANPSFLFPILLNIIKSPILPLSKRANVGNIPDPMDITIK